MKKTGDLVMIAGRYILLLILGIVMYYSDVFYNIFFMLTAYPATFLLWFFYSTSISGSSIIVNNQVIELIPACIAVSAYFLLLMLNFTTRMDTAKRIFSIIFSFLSLLAINIIRIFIMCLLVMTNRVYFDVFHMLTWYILSVLIVVGIWFLTVYIFDIEDIPVYSDFKMILSNYKKPVKTVHKTVIHRVRRKKITHRNHAYKNTHNRLGYYYIKHAPHKKTQLRIRRKQ